MTKAFWPLPDDPVTDLQRKLLQERILAIPKKATRWIVSRWPQWWLPSREGAEAMVALGEMGEPRRVQGGYFSSGWMTIPRITSWPSDWSGSSLPYPLHTDLSLPSKLRLAIRAFVRELR